MAMDIFIRQGFNVLFFFIHSNDGRTWLLSVAALPLLPLLHTGHLWGKKKAYSRARVNICHNANAPLRDTKDFTRLCFTVQQLQLIDLSSGCNKQSLDQLMRFFQTGWP